MYRLDKNYQIWIVDASDDDRQLYRSVLGARYCLRVFESFKDFISTVSEKKELQPDLVISDLKVKEESFLHWCTDGMSLSITDIPFLLISSFDDVEILKRCFSLGVADYLTKPCNRGELIVKVERILSGLKKNQCVSIDRTNLRAETQHGSIKLTPKEMQILTALNHVPGAAVSRLKVAEYVWGAGALVGPKTLDVHLFNLRKKARKLGVEINHVQPASLVLLPRCSSAG